MGRLRTGTGLGEPARQGMWPPAPTSRLSGWGGGRSFLLARSGARLAHDTSPQFSSHFLALSILLFLWQLPSGLCVTLLKHTWGSCQAVRMWAPRGPGASLPSSPFGPTPRPVTEGESSPLPRSLSGVGVPVPSWVQASRCQRGTVSVLGMSPLSGQPVGQASKAVVRVLAGQAGRRRADRKRDSAGREPDNEVKPESAAGARLAAEGPGRVRTVWEDGSELAPPGPCLLGAGLPRWWRTPFPSTKRTWKSHRGKSVSRTALAHQARESCSKQSGIATPGTGGF